MREAFLQFDSDRDGFIQLDDLRRMAVRLGEVVEDDMLQSMLHDADVDADDGRCECLCVRVFVCSSRITQ